MILFFFFFDLICRVEWWGGELIDFFNIKFSKESSGGGGGEIRYYLCVCVCMWDLIISKHNE